MDRSCSFFVLVLVALHANYACNVSGDFGLVSQKKLMPDSDSKKEQTLQDNAPNADSLEGNGIGNKN